MFRLRRRRLRLLRIEGGLERAASQMLRVGRPRTERFVGGVSRDVSAARANSDGLAARIGSGASARRVSAAVAWAATGALGMAGALGFSIALAAAPSASSPTNANAMAMAASGATTASGTAPTAGELVGTQPFTNHRNPPPYRKLTDAEFARYDLGMTVFNTQFVAAGTPGAGRRDGVGPLFNSASCDACHNNGAHGRGPTEDGPAPTPLVVQLSTPLWPSSPPGSSAGSALAGSSSAALDPPGDPVYGRVFNTAALEGSAPEGVVMIQYTESAGHYRDGTAWSLRVPRYTFTKLRYGPLAAQTIVKPRMAPALFGVGLLDAAGAQLNGTSPSPAPGAKRTGTSTTASAKRTSAPGRAGAEHTGASTTASATRTDASSAAGAGARDLRSRAHEADHGLFGWQASALTVRDQTARAFAREMGLTSSDINHDDCTAAESDCLNQPNGGSPEVSDDLFDAVLSFQRWLAVPPSPSPHPTPDPGAKVFANLGCASCHQPRLPVTLTDAEGKNYAAVIAPYTDLRLHDLGSRLADEDVAGHKVPSKWRTPPLWGLGYRVSFERLPTFLHDGRARSAEEAILWHDGEAAAARERFANLSAAQRKAFLHWLETI